MDIKDLIDPEFGAPPTDTELVQWTQDIGAELNRRRLLEQIPEQVAMLNREFLSAEGVQEGAAWRQPTGAHDAYPIGFQVSHNGKDWISTVANNVWEPGVSGWKEIVAEGDLAEWVQPTGSHDAYGVDVEVQHVSRHWKSLIGDNIWEPGAVGSEALWEDLGPWPPESPA